MQLSIRTALFLSALFFCTACSPTDPIVCPKKWTQAEMNQMATEEASLRDGSMTAAQLLDYARIRRELRRSCP
jgi:hypothetical protein